MRRSVRIKSIALALLFCLTALIWYAVWREDARGRLAVSFLNVGQGNATYIEAPSGQRVLIDGGPDGSVLRRLGAVMPPWERSLDLVLATSPDEDDVGGLVDVLERYRVALVVQSGVENSTPVWNLFEKSAARTHIVTARRGQVIDLGKGAYLEILSPDRAVPRVSPTEGCVVAKLVYGATAFMLPCDATQGVQTYLAMLDGMKLRADVLAVGAKQNISPIFSGYVAPTYIVAQGCVSATTTPNAESLRTCEGAVTFVSDGHTVVRK